MIQIQHLHLKNFLKTSLKYILVTPNYFVLYRCMTIVSLTTDGKLILENLHGVVCSSLMMGTHFAVSVLARANPKTVSLLPRLMPLRNNHKLKMTTGTYCFHVDWGCGFIHNQHTTFPHKGSCQAKQLTLTQAKIFSSFCNGSICHSDMKKVGIIIHDWGNIINLIFIDLANYSTMLSTFDF